MAIDRGVRTITIMMVWDSEAAAEPAAVTSFVAQVESMSQALQAASAEIDIVRMSSDERIASRDVREWRSPRSLPPVPDPERGK